MNVDPKKPIQKKIGDVTFTIRAITDREKLRLLPGMLSSISSLQFQAITFAPQIVESVLKTGLIGWDHDQVKFSNDMETNLDYLEQDEMLELFNAILKESGFSIEEEKNADGQSGSVETDSTAATKTPAPALAD